MWISNTCKETKKSNPKLTNTLLIPTSPSKQFNFTSLTDKWVEVEGAIPSRAPSFPVRTQVFAELCPSPAITCQSTVIQARRTFLDLVIFSILKMSKDITRNKCSLSWDSNINFGAQASQVFFVIVHILKRISSIMIF